jgi:hypothetical protein
MTDIRIFIPDTFIPERRYIIDELFSEYLGLDYEVEAVPGEKAYRIEIGGTGQLIVRDHFFGRFEDGLGYLRPDNMPVKAIYVKNPFISEPDIPLIYGNEEMGIADGRIFCGLDLFASSFFMLTRWEEHVNKARDTHDRFPATSSLALKSGFLLRPVVDEYVEMLWSMLLFLGCGQQRKLRTFNLVLTHDLDAPLRWCNFSLLRVCATDLLKQQDLALAFRDAKNFLLTKLGANNDPFDTFDWIMDISEEFGVKSHFFFMAGGKSAYDAPHYSVESPSICGLLDKIHTRGHTIGFHPSYNAFNDEAEWGKEFLRLTHVSPQKITAGRGHYLRYQVPDSWDIWDSHGMEWDSSLGYADHEGFRCGTCHEYSVFNFLKRKKLKLKEIPLIVMEGTLSLYRRKNPEEFRESVYSLIDTVKKYNGSFVLLWHNSSFNTPFWEPYKKIYLDILRYSTR